MKISVLIAAHESGAQIGDALACVRAQFHSDWELMVVEYNSADGTREVVRDFGVAARRPVHYLNLGENHGEASARNRLLELATTDGVAFLDPADRWTPRHLANATTLLTSEADVVASDVRLVDHATGESLGDLAVPAQLSRNPIRPLFARDVFAIPSAVAFRRELLKRVGLLDLRFRAHETRDFWLRCALNGARFAVTHATTCQTTRRPKLSAVRALLNAEQAVLFYEKHRNVSAVPAALRRRLLSESLVTQGRLLRTSDPTRAARCFWRAWSLQPVQVQTLGQFALTGWGSTAKSASAPKPAGGPASESSSNPFPVRSESGHNRG